MTINVVVATFHAVVLGCDSLSSMVEPAFFPFRGGSSLAMGADGEPLKDAEGFFLVPYRPDQVVQTATNIMGGVQKMFLLCEDRDGENVDCSVAALTSGLGTLSGLTIAEVASRFRRQSLLSGHPVRALDVCTAFLEFVRPKWEAQVGFQEGVEQPWLPNLRFLIAGYGPDDTYIKVFRIDVAANTCEEQFSDEPHCSAAWDGQASTVARMINGYDTSLRQQVSRGILEALRSQRTSIVASLLTQLESAGVLVPENLDLQVEEVLPPALPWHDAAASINWSNLPVQTAVDLVSAMVNAESGMQKFSQQIAMVGGRTRIGLVRRNQPFEQLNEPSITHSHIGYNADA